MAVKNSEEPEILEDEFDASLGTKNELSSSHRLDQPLIGTSNRKCWCRRFIVMKEF